jgi:thiol-disulfide isomerase/thioredoxin
MIEEINESNFFLQNIDFESLKMGKVPKIIFLFIKAQWCGYCVKYEPTFRAFAEAHPEVGCFILDEANAKTLIPQWNELANPKFTAKSFPTLVLYDGETGKPVKIVEDRNALETELVMLKL